MPLAILDPYEYDRSFSTTYPTFLQDDLKTPLIISGVDEAGRGPLAGPVVVAAVILPENPRIIGLRDSKVIPLEQREALYCEIIETALAFKVSVVEVDVIDQMNILRATLYGMRQCLENLPMKPNLALVDGNQKPGSLVTEKTIVKGDSLSASIMAASILAKVTRDQIMLEEHEKYPEYGFDEHKGYGCAKHIDAIKKYGATPIHRKSFEPLKSLLQGPLFKSN